MRGKIINLNKINKVLKVLAKHNLEDFTIYVSEYSSSKVIITNKISINWELGEDLITMFKKENITWTISVQNNNMIINVL